ncbi:MAG: PLDc_N domain-containing protein, partial [Bacilli bacterium]|nr:PLDc_N domain-containing protein [Bacilli bacterium]
MKKFFRNLLSGYLLVLLILLVQIAVVIYMNFYMDDLIAKWLNDGNSTTQVKAIITLSYLLFKVLLFVIEVVIFFKIINKEEDPEFKVPWLVCLFLMPLFCMFMFLIFGNHGLRKKDRKVLTETIKAYKSNTPEANDESVFEGSVGAFNYLSNTTHLAP